MIHPNDAWDYFRHDPHYSEVLKNRLISGVEMDSAKALGHYVNQLCRGDLRVLDFGGGPGHYGPVIRRLYQHGSLHYTSVDIDAANISYGGQHFADDLAMALQLGSVLTPNACYGGQNCIVSANTLPHVPTIAPLLSLLATEARIEYFVCRMLIGNECVQIKKHLREHDFDGLFEQHYQHNNIYSAAYLTQALGPAWQISIEPDIFDVERLQHHQVPAQDSDPFYSNRVSRPVGTMIFKGDIYMPWRFVLGRRSAQP